MLKLGLCITGSFCSLKGMLEVLSMLKKQYDIEVFMTPNVDHMDTRFFKASHLKEKIYEILDKDVHTTIQQAEIYGPQKKLDIVLVYPCDALTMAKLVYGINDNCVTMLIKSSLRNQIPIVLGVFSNDILSNSGKNLFSLMNTKNYYFIPMFQDDYKNKPNSMIASQDEVVPTLDCALNHQQNQPFLLGYKEV